jgi:DNA-binding response OmpR family regulator
MPAPNLHILLADDEAEIASLISSVLKRSGHKVDVAEDGRAALELLKEKPGMHDLVITDSNMPYLSGIELIEHLRETRFPGKIILLSGDITSELQDVYQSLNIDRIIQKPFAFTELTGAVKELGADLQASRPDHPA